MWASGIVKGQISANAATGLGHGLVGVEIDLLVFDRPPEPLDEDIVRQTPLPSIEMAISAFFSTAVKSIEVNCDPWSLLKISGLPSRASASSTASMQKAASIVTDSRHDRTFRLNQSTRAQR